MITTSKKSNRMARRRGGQTIVETAFMMSFVLLPLTLGLLQFCVILNATNTLTQIAREGARYAAVHGTEANSDAIIKDYVQAVAAGTTILATDIPDANITIAMLPTSGTTIPARVSGNPINVRIKYPMAKKIFIPNLLGVPWMNKLKADYYAESTFVLE